MDENKKRKRKQKEREREREMSKGENELWPRLRCTARGKKGRGKKFKVTYAVAV